MSNGNFIALFSVRGWNWSLFWQMVSKCVPYFRRLSESALLFLISSSFYGYLKMKIHDKRFLEIFGQEHGVMIEFWFISIRNAYFFLLFSFSHFSSFLSILFISSRFLWTIQCGCQTIGRAEISARFSRKSQNSTFSCLIFVLYLFLFLFSIHVSLDIFSRHVCYVFSTRSNWIL